MKRVLWLFPLLLALSGCSTMSGWFGGSDNATPPTELESITADLELERVWSVDVGKGTDDQAVRLEPAAADGRIYAADARGRVVALDAATGDEVWEQDLETPVTGAVGLGYGVVLVGTGDAEVVALDRNDGTVRWRSRVSSEVLAPPQGAEGRVMVQASDGSLWGLNGSDGNRSWVYERGTPVLTLRGTSAPVLTRGAVLAGFASGKLIAFNAQNGGIFWERAIAVPRGRSELERIVDIDADPVVVDDRVYVVAYHGRLEALNLFKGETLWEREFSSVTGLDANRRMVVAADDTDQVWGLEPERGAAMWRQEKLVGRKLSRPILFDGNVAVGDFEGYLHILDGDDGHFRARVSVDGSAVTGIVVAGDLLVVSSADGEITALRRK